MNSLALPLLFALVLACLPVEAFADRLEGLVVAVADGDTITVLDDARARHRIRLSGIDAPEKRQAFGNVSRQRLADAVFQRRVVVEYGKTDRYGRLVGKVLLDGQDECLAQIAAGLAWHYKKYEGEQPVEDRHAYAAAEDAARAARRGLWRDPNPVPPWEWRHPAHGDARNQAAGAEAIPHQSGGGTACGAKQTCRQMVSCAEARFYMDRCNVAGLDG